MLKFERLESQINIGSNKTKGHKQDSKNGRSLLHAKNVTFSADDALVHVLFYGRVVYFIRPAKLGDAVHASQFLLRCSLENLS